MRQVIVHDEAEAEFREAAIFYESQASGLGDDLIAEVKGAIESVVRYPEAGPVVRGGARRRLVLRFPYAVIYRIEPDRIPPRETLAAIAMELGDMKAAERTAQDILLRDPNNEKANNIINKAGGR